MAKEVGKFEIVIRGDASGPTEAWVRYVIRDSVNTELSARREKKLDISTGQLNKVAHSSAAAGEFWKDTLDEVRSDEGAA